MLSSLSTFYSEPTFGSRHFAPDGHLPLLPKTLHSPRPLSPHPWQTVGNPPKCVGQYQGMCAFMAGWIHEPTQSLDPHLSHMSQTQGIAHTNTGLSSKKYRTYSMTTMRIRKSYAHTDSFRLSHMNVAQHGNRRIRVPFCLLTISLPPCTHPSLHQSKLLCIKNWFEIE